VPIALGAVLLISPPELAIVGVSKIRLHVGTAAWVNPPGERVRRGAGSHLAHYSKTFDAVEINTSFYRSHRYATYERWRDVTPPNFCFSVKMPRSITHECALRRCRSELRQFLSEVHGLGKKLRVILVQLPANLIFESGVAARFFEALVANSSFRVACEPRHGSWFGSGAEDLFRHYDIARVAADPPKHPGGDRPGGSHNLVYYRLHGSPKVYYSAYTDEFLSRLATTIRGTSAISEDRWCIFDNTALHQGWSNAQYLLTLLHWNPTVESARNTGR
jgi:uncharacterized protein YecE (DUF72 family)